MSHSQPSSSAWLRVAELDGMRGLAILLVLATHIFKRAAYFTENPFLLALAQPARLGWVGVDVFFVLSGFLITGILLRTRTQPGYFRNFYARRILRIFPLYYLLVGGLLFFLPHLDNDLGAYTQGFWPVFFLYQQNWLYLREPEPSLLLGLTWSLAIEEQFYLLWPAVVRWLEPRRLQIGSAAIVLFSLLLRLALLAGQTWLGADFSPAKLFYYGTFTRFEGLAAGAFLALLAEKDGFLAQKGHRAALWALPLTVGLFLALALSGDPNPVSTNLPLMAFGYTLLALASAALLILLITDPPQSWLRRVFRSRLMVFFGQYSYAMYLIHLPLISVLLAVMWRSGRRNALMYFVYLALSYGGTVLLALFSWHALEKHMLALKRHFSA